MVNGFYVSLLIILKKIDGRVREWENWAKNQGDFMHAIHEFYEIAWE